jgi:hypothetical protein
MSSCELRLHTDEDVLELEQTACVQMRRVWSWNNSWDAKIAGETTKITGETPE